MEILLPIFTEVQKGIAGHKHNSKKLVAIVQGGTDEENAGIIQIILRGCLDQCLLCSKKEPAVENMIRFLVLFISSVTNETCFTLLMEHLSRRSRVTDKGARLRACQMIAAIISNIAEGDGIAEELLLSLQRSLLSRLHDKIPAFRVAAIKALYLLAEPQKDSDPITDTILALLNKDSSKDVRVAAVEYICLTKQTLPLIISRIRDVQAEVRLAVCKRLAKDVPIKILSPSLITVIVQHGMNDRDVQVKNATTDLILRWLSTMEHNVPKLLRLVDLEAHEEEAELLGMTILEAADKRSDVVSQELTSAIRQQCPDWDRGFATLRPSEVLWVCLRCEYARKNLTPLAAVETLDALMPDMVKLCSVLEEANKPTLCVNVKHQYTVRYLLRMMAFADSSDVCGCKALMSVCEAMVKNIHLPDILVEPVLASWLHGSNFNSPAEAIRTAVNLSQLILLRPSPSTPIVADSVGESISLVDMEEDMEMGEEERLSEDTLRSVRSLQMIAWSLQQNIGARGAIKGSEAFDEIVPFVRDNLQKPSPELRGLAVRCLGLLGLLNEGHCNEFVDIIFQVARNDIEDSVIRSQALEALADMATVYDRFINDNALTAFLLRLQEQGAEPALQRVAAEASAKLLFAARLSEPRLFATLLKFFFLPELAEDSSSASGRPQVETDAYLGSAARLQQILSIFFQAFFVAGNGREQTVQDCVSDLVADIAMMVRDQEVDPDALNKVCCHLLVLCDHVRPSSAGISKAAAAESVRNELRKRLAASVFRELLKLGNSKIEAASAKEFVKVLGALAPSAWIDSQLAPTVRSIACALASNAKLDKTSMKVIDKYILTCDQASSDSFATVKLQGVDAADKENAQENDLHSFYALAPGLADLVSLLDKSIDYEYVPAEAATSNNNRIRRAPRSQQVEAESDSESSEEDFEASAESCDEDDQRRKPARGKVVTTTKRPVSKALPVLVGTSERVSLARFSKTAASFKITSDLADENNCEDSDDGNLSKANKLISRQRRNGKGRLSGDAACEASENISSNVLG